MVRGALWQSIQFDQKGVVTHMPSIYLSPSLQPYNKYVTTGDEQYWMNVIADDMVPILEKNGIAVTRNTPGDYTPYHAVLWGSDGDTDRFIASESAGFGSLPTGVQYARFAENMYTAVPDSLERLRAFCRENPQSGFENTRDFILRALHGAAEYTLSPGLVPPGADPAEYFFFDNRRGYCEHFATTAALLFRLYGYPARYAVGYVADDFTRQADGAYQAVLTDREAHAWVEVFADGAWTPVEATPPGAVVEAPAENDVRPVEVLTGDAVSP